jgi:C-methyltransferase
MSEGPCRLLLASGVGMVEQQPHELVWALATGAVAARCLQVVSELGVADALGPEPARVDVLAARCGLDADALDRVLHLLADQGVFARSADGYSHTAASELLRSDHPMSMRAFPRMMGSPMAWDSFGSLAHSVRTGSPGMAQVEPRGMWAYFETRPQEAQIFGEAMTAKAAADVMAVLAAYDFSGIGVLADIGGGRGHLLRAVLDAAPRTRGVLVDLPAVIDQLEVHHERLEPRAADFFTDPLPSADAYLLMEVLHDWPDSQAAAILTAVRKAASPGARILVIENMLDDNQPDIRGHILDVIMLAVAGGRERTVTELSALLSEAGFSDTTSQSTQGPMRILEAHFA